MALTPEQTAAINAELSVDLATVTDDRLIELCLLYRSAPSVLPSFPDALATEITRRFTAAEIAANDVMFSVIQNFSNQFISPIPFFQQKMLEMAASVNRDIWFTNNLALFTDATINGDLMAWLVTQPDVLTKVLHNGIALPIVAQSTTASTAILTHDPAVTLWKQATNLWSIWPNHTAGMTVLAKSSELMSYVAASSTAMTAVAASSTAMTAVIASSTAMTAVIASSTAMTAVAASSTAMTAVVASSTALSAIVKSTSARNALMSSNTILQAKRAAIFTTIKSNWTMSRRLTYNQGNASNAKQHCAAPQGFVFAYLGKYSTAYTSIMNMLHPDNTLAASGETRNMDNATFILTQDIDVISFDGMSLGFLGDQPRASIELWIPPT